MELGVSVGLVGYVRYVFPVLNSVADGRVSTAVLRLRRTFWLTCDSLSVIEGPDQWKPT